MIEQVRLAFAALQTSRPAEAGGLSVAPTDTGHPAWVAFDDQWRPHLLLAADPSARLPEPVDAVRITHRPLIIGGIIHDVIDAVCVVETLTDVFEQFAAAVLEQLTNTTAPADALDVVLGTWRRFLHTTAATLPGRERLAGLFAELLVLRELATSDPAMAVRTWAAAERARHDFRAGPFAIEVKSSLAAAGYRITIHGVEQLAPPEGGTLHVVFYRLETAPGQGRSIADLVEELLESGVQPAHLYRALDAAGLAPQLLPLTGSTPFTVREEVVVPVDDLTPRIVPESFVTGSAPTGVSNVAYDVDLGPQTSRAVTPGQIAELQRRLIGAASEAT